MDTFLYKLVLKFKPFLVVFKETRVAEGCEGQKVTVPFRGDREPKSRHLTSLR